MECFGALLTVCASLALARVEAPVRLSLNFPDVCLFGCGPTSLTLGSPRLAPKPRSLAGRDEHPWATDSLLEIDKLRSNDRLMVDLARPRSSLGAADLGTGPAFLPLRVPELARAPKARAGLFGYSRAESPLIAGCIPGQCWVSMVDLANREPWMVFQGARRVTGEMGGQLKLGSWFHATGRIWFDGNNREIVHMQDVAVGETEALRGRLTVSGTLRNTFRYFDSSDIRGLSLSAETGPVLGVRLPGSGDIMSITATAGPDLRFGRGLSATVNLGLVYEH